MKKLSILLSGAAILFSTFTYADKLQSFEGAFERGEGYYYLNTTDTKLKLADVDFNVDHIKSGSQVQVLGLSEEKGLEVHRFAVKTESGFKTVYNWEQLDEELYH